MLNENMLRVSLRQQAFLLPSRACSSPITHHTLSLVAELRQAGFAVSEDLLHAINALDADERTQLLGVIDDVMGLSLNWASLVKGWLTPTGETVWDHFVTLVANTLPDHARMQGTTLPCGHFIPDDTFPLSRYNGCPFCGTPFITDGRPHTGQGTRLRILQLWDDRRLDAHLLDLLASPVPLDATQRSSLQLLLADRPLPPQVHIRMKETRMMVIDTLVDRGDDTQAARLMDSPADVLRYLWHRHTGHVQLLQPRTLLHTAAKNHRYEWNTQADIDARLDEVRRQLKLKYSRAWCRRVALWLNGLAMPIDRQLETMHPQRQMWVRMIRALRLADYARRDGFEQLRTLMDRFYRSDYDVWQGEVDRLLAVRDTGAALDMLRQRPGTFARCLFSTMLRLGASPTIEAFKTVADAVPPRLLISLGMQADIYFDRDAQRVVRPLSGVVHKVGPHPLTAGFTDQELRQMSADVRSLYLDAMRRRFGRQSTPADGHHPRTIYIDPQLDNIPVSVADRSSTVSDVACALQGTRFDVEGDSVRLFLQWGKDLPAQHLDMDLSCYILTDTEADVCSYFHLSTVGARHSGDIQRIPDRVGTAEYVELSLPQLVERGARRVVFTCNAYTAGALQPGLMVGWMDAAQPMTVSDDNGAAYDPSTVQHMVRISEPNLSKGLIFGVLEVARRQIVWLEMPFDGQTVLSISPQTVDAYMRRLAAKPTIGQVLRLKAEAQHLAQADTPQQADEAYTLPWAQDTARVASLLLNE